MATKPEAEDDFHSTIEGLKLAPKETRKARVDSMCPLSSNPIVQVYEDYDCTLNQTNIGNNNNKFYLIQLLDENGQYSCWNRWGRVVSGHSAWVSEEHLLTQRV